MDNSALIAMSGGVDSSVAAYLTLRSGYSCVGAMMRLYSNEDAGFSADSGCCSAADAEDARSVADRLGIPFYVFNFMDSFEEHVIDRFIAAYAAGETPNPCIDCNRYLKFERFLHRAIELNISRVVTGHYARIEKNGDRFLLKKGVDDSKDQSYVLYRMTQEQLSKTLLPLGDLTKARVREIALEQGFVTAKKSDSQDLCFVPDGDYAGFIERYTGKRFPSGPFTDTRGNSLGEHDGIIRYTVGQRRGLGLSYPEPVYVKEILSKENTVVLGTEKELYSKELLARDINLIASKSLESPVKAAVKLRYRHMAQPATVFQTGRDELRVVFDTPQRAVTRGQAAVIYDGDAVLGGGVIA